MKKARLVILNILLFFFFLIISFSFLELITRLQNKQSRKNVYDIQRVPVPYIGFAGKPNNADHNELGYRGKLIEKSEGVDIVILGGSTIYNGSPSLPRLIELELQKRKPNQKINVYNYGIPSTKSSGELSRLVHQIIQHKPEIVIAYHGANDIGLFGGDPRVGYPFDFYIIEKNPLSTSLKEPLSTLELLITRSHFIRYYYPNIIHKKILGIRDLKGGEFSYSRNRAQLAVDLLYQNISKMNQLSKAYGIKYHSIIQPIKKQLKKQDNGLWFGNQVLREKVDKENFTYVTSLLEYLEKRQECFVDQVHIEQRCKSLIAKKVSGIIEDLL